MLMLPLLRHGSALPGLTRAWRIERISPIFQSQTPELAQLLPPPPQQSFFEQSRLPAMEGGLRR